MTLHTTFPLGRLVATVNAFDKLSDHELFEALRRHASRDWGALSNDDREANDRALQDGTRILSVYTSAAGVRFWIITEADRSATTVLLPEDY